MKTIRFLSYFAVIIFAGLMIASCGSAESKLPGTWVTEDVTVSVDSSMANLASIDISIASSKTTTFTLNEDHSMSLSIDGYSTDAFWTYDSDKGIVSFRMEAESIDDPIELGKLDGNKIVYTSNVKHGTITAVYIKK